MKRFIKTRSPIRWFRSQVATSAAPVFSVNTGKMSIDSRKSKVRGSAARPKGVISDPTEAVGWVLCHPDRPLSQGWIVVHTRSDGRGTLRKIDGTATAQSATIHDVFGRSDRALMRVKCAPGTAFMLDGERRFIKSVEAGAEVPRVTIAGAGVPALGLALQKVVNSPTFAVLPDEENLQTSDSSNSPS